MGKFQYFTARLTPLYNKQRHHDARGMGGWRRKEETAVAVDNKIGQLSDANFASEVLEHTGAPVLVDFWAAWCGPCRMLAPIVEELAGEYGDKLKVTKLDVDENPVTAGKYGIMSIPTLLVFKGGQPVEKIVGYHTKRELKAVLDRVV